MRLDELMAEISRLMDAHEAQEADDPGEGNFRCENCTACYSCRFCVDCDSCEDCTYCEECVDCAKCTHCKRSVSCVESTYIEDSRDCDGGRYLTLCVACKDCVHCLGCVGLTGAEFFVLNEKRSRKEYFQILRAIQAELGERLTRGWRPAAIGLISELAEADDTVWPGPTEVTHTQDLGDLAAQPSRRPTLGASSSDDSGWAWTEPPPDEPRREHTGIDDLPPPPPYDTDAGIDPPEEISSPWIDEPRRDSTWHGDEGDARSSGGAARRSSAWLDPLATGPQGDRSGAAADGERRGLLRASRPARPRETEPEDSWRHRTGSGSGSVGSGSGVGRRRDASTGRVGRRGDLEESSMVRPRKPSRDGSDRIDTGRERSAPREPAPSDSRGRGLRSARRPSRPRRDETD